MEKFPDAETQSEDHLDRLTEEFGLKQRNTIFPDTVRNGVNVDVLLWKGSHKLTLVQRVGIAIFGCFFILGALMVASHAAESHSILGALIACGVLYVGGRILMNSIPKTAKEKSKR